jgi:hypothetical protein
VASLLPPLAEGPYDGDGTFVFDALNVYANAPVDADIVSAPPIGTGATLRFFIDHQRTSPGSYPNLDWPIFLAEAAVSPSGAVRDDHAPANVPLFEQLRDASGRVPLTHAPDGERGAAHVAGMNFGRPGSIARCVGCHIGHSMIPVPQNDDDAAWTNLAPGAAVTASSTRTPEAIAGLVDRRAAKAQLDRVWSSEPGSRPFGQWVELRFPVPIRVRTVRLYGPSRGGDGHSSLDVQSTRITLLGESGTPLASSMSGDVQPAGTDVSFDGVGVRSVKVEFLQVSGSFLGASVAALSEIEVIGRGLGP